jgi:hypothetical protein
MKSTELILELITIFTPIFVVGLSIFDLTLIAQLKTLTEV